MKERVAKKIFYQIETVNLQILYGNQQLHIVYMCRNNATKGEISVKEKGGKEDLLQNGKNLYYNNQHNSNKNRY